MTPNPALPRVSGAVDLTAAGAVSDQAAVALSAIDAVHGDGKLPKIPLEYSPTMSAGAEFIYDPRRGGPPKRIDARKTGRTALDVVHEVGHFLDYMALESPCSFATESQPKSKHLAALLGALKKTKAHSRLEKTRDDDFVMVLDPLGRKTPTGRRRKERLLLTKDFRKEAKYLLEPAELFGRAYAQYITIRSKNSTLIEELEAWRLRPQELYLPWFWTDRDFKPVAAAFDALFRELSWVS